MLEKGDIDQAAMVRNINIAFSSILFDQSLILLGKTRERELLRGVYNNRFNKITNDKDERKMIFSLWVYCYEELKNKFGKKGLLGDLARIDSTRVPDVIIMPNFFVQEFIVSWEAGNLRFYHVIYCNNYLKSSDFSVMDIRVSNFQHNSRVIRGKNILTKVE
ncbi:unnamed protein product [Rhizophagus irregularis]|nr:unnamed protein product [Rhizophagus irregularis]